MRRLVVAFAVFTIAVLAGAARAQDRFEIIPFAGYRWGGGLSTVSGVHDFDTQDTWAYGVTLARQLPHSSGAEIYYSHFSGDLTATLNVGPLGNKVKATLRRDDILLNGDWYAGGYRQQTRPYLSAGIGASIFSSDRSETIGRFAWSLGAGVRHDVNERLAVRLDGRWMPTWVTTGSGIWCDPFACYSVGTGESYDQFELALGLALRLGGH